MVNEAPFTTTFNVNFVRGYDMVDPAIEVLRRNGVVTHQHVDGAMPEFG